jgi:hypothetical protein
VNTFYFCFAISYYRNSVRSGRRQWSLCWATRTRKPWPRSAPATLARVAHNPREDGLRVRNRWLLLFCIHVRARNLLVRKQKLTMRKFGWTGRAEAGADSTGQGRQGQHQRHGHPLDLIVCGGWTSHPAHPFAAPDPHRATCACVECRQLVRGHPARITARGARWRMLARIPHDSESKRPSGFKSSNRCNFSVVRGPNRPSELGRA